MTETGQELTIITCTHPDVLLGAHEALSHVDNVCKGEGGIGGNVGLAKILLSHCFLPTADEHNSGVVNLRNGVTNRTPFVERRASVLKGGRQWSVSGD